MEPCTNRRKSQLRRLQNRFLGCFFGFRDPKTSLFDRLSLFRIPDIEVASWVMSNEVDSRIGASGDTKSTDHDIKSTDHDMKSTDHDIWRHFHDTSRHDAKVDLRRIVSDFLTLRIRVGEVVIVNNNSVVHRRTFAYRNCIWCPLTCLSHFRGSPCVTLTR